MKYIVDHAKKSVHRTAFAKDECGFRETPIDEREGTYDDSYLKNLEKDGYVKCEHCFKPSFQYLNTVLLGKFFKK